MGQPTTMRIFNEKLDVFERWLSRLRLYAWALGIPLAALTYALPRAYLTIFALIVLALLSVVVAVISIILQIYYRGHQLPLPKRAWWSGVTNSIVAVPLFFIALWYYVTIYQVDQLFEKSLPGFSFISVISIQPIVPRRRQYVFEASSPEGARVAFFLSASEHFTFTVTDVHGEPYSLEVPVGHNQVIGIFYEFLCSIGVDSDRCQKGIPVNEFIYLLCEVGIASDRSYIRIMLNDKVIQYRILYFPIDLGNKQWRNRLGSDINGRNNGAFLLGEFGTFNVTVSKEQFGRLSENARAHYGLTY